MECEYNEEVHQLFTDFKKAYDSVRREVLRGLKELMLAMARRKKPAMPAGKSRTTSGSGV